MQSFDMMQNLFDWVTTQKGGLEPRKVEIDVSGLIQSIIKLFSSEAKKKNIDLSLKSEAELKLFSDIDMLNTVLRNLVSNALKFTKNDGEIKISYSKQDNIVQFDVEDNGIGIPEEKLEAVFDAHRNRSTKGTNNEKGTGLGLVLCKEFTDILGGKIWVKSTVGEGSCFSFSIPAE
ncbi:MAG: HAMP domain-containing histidine kinase [Chloroflexia bacterium]|nr:HAMP domain-containing histidine kinase [Chloroflexia bacterium]